MDYYKAYIYCKPRQGPNPLIFISQSRRNNNGSNHMCSILRRFMLENIHILGNVRDGDSWNWKLVGDLFNALAKNL